MRLFSLGLTTLLHGFYALIWVAVLLDVGSPTSISTCPPGA